MCLVGGIESWEFWGVAGLVVLVAETSVALVALESMQ